MPHSYGSSFTLLYFFVCTACERSSVTQAKPMATNRKMAIGMYALSIVMGVAGPVRPWETRVYNTRMKRASRNGAGSMQHLDVPANLRSAKVFGYGHLLDGLIDRHLYWR